MTVRFGHRRPRAAIVVVALAFASVGIAGTALAADQAVDIVGFAFSPQTITVSVGDTVTWSNDDAQGHTATADDGSFDTGTISHGSSKSVTFTTAGTVAYHCKIHPSMTATVAVAAADEATVPPTDTLAAATPPAMDGSPGPMAIIVVAGAIGVGLWRFRAASWSPRRR
jgi:plastocyanin